MATAPTPQPAPTPSPTPVEGVSIPILPAHDVAVTLAFFERLGFTTTAYEGFGYGIVRRGTIELHFTAAHGHDPWGGGAGAAFVRLDNVDALYGEFVASGAAPVMARPGLSADDLRARWDAGESIARLGVPEDKPWGIREFPLLDPSNNLIRFGRSGFPAP